MPEPTTIDTGRLAKITTLKSGAHSGIRSGACVMEAVAYVARLPWSDHPQCVCPVLGAFMRSWNDGLPDDESRARLLMPLIPKLVNTRGSATLSEKRSLMATDWLVREHTPAWLELAGLTAQAATLRALPEITSMAQVPSIRGPLEAVRKDAAAAWAAAWDAAGDAAGAAARDAAWDAAGDAARAAAWDAAGDAAGAAAGAAAWAAAGDAAGAAAGAAARAAAWDAAGAAAGAAARAAAWDAAGAAARAAAGAAAWDAAWDAAGDAAGAKLTPTLDALQLSALALVERMIVAEDPAPEISKKEPA